MPGEGDRAAAVPAALDRGPRMLVLLTVRMMAAGDVGAGLEAGKPIMAGSDIGSVKEVER